jgi:hypothetical protein
MLHHAVKVDLVRVTTIRQNFLGLVALIYWE